MSGPEPGRADAGETYASTGASIALIGTDLSTGGGVNRVICDLAYLLDRELGCRVTVFSARSDREPSYAMPPGVQLERARPRESGRLAYVRRLLGLRRREFDYAVGFWAQDNLLLILALLFCRTRVIVCEHQSHGFPPLPVRLARRLLYRRAWRVSVLNDVELRHYSSFLDNVRLVPNPVVQPETPPPTARERLVIGVGHLIERKGFTDLLSAWARSGLGRDGWRLAIIGDGSERARLQVQIERDRIPSVDLIPATADLGSWYRWAQILVSTASVEVFSLVLAEAVYHGIVPLAYDADGPSYLLRGFPQLLVPIGDVDTLAARLSQLARDADRPQIAAAVEKSLRSRISRRRVVEGWAEMLAHGPASSSSSA